MLENRILGNCHLEEDTISYNKLETMLQNERKIIDSDGNARTAVTLTAQNVVPAVLKGGHHRWAISIIRFTTSERECYRAKEQRAKEWECYLILSYLKREWECYRAISFCHTYPFGVLSLSQTISRRHAYQDWDCWREIIGNGESKREHVVSAVSNFKFHRKQPNAILLIAASDGDND